MLDVATGFAVIGLAIVVGYVLGRIDLLGPHARYVLARLVFFVLSPFLLFVVLAQADVTSLFSALLPVSTMAAVVIIAVYVLIARFVWHRRVGDVVIGGLAAGQVNSNNIGIPLSLYLLGSAAYPAPVILMQLLLLTPISMAILESVTTGTRRVMPLVRRTLLNPIVLGSLAGTLVSVSGIDLPQIVLAPMSLIADACVPVMLISYGISLYGQRVLSARQHRAEILLATGLKLLVMPVLAWAIAAFVFQMSPDEVLVVTVLAALPTAQNVFNAAQRFDVGEAVARDTVLLTTIGCLPVLLLTMFLLG